MIGLVGTREVVRSLRTRDGRAARTQACFIRSELDGVFDQVRMKRTVKELTLILRDSSSVALETHVSQLGASKMKRLELKCFIGSGLSGYPQIQYPISRPIPKPLVKPIHAERCG